MHEMGEISPQCLEQILNKGKRSWPSMKLVKQSLNNLANT